MVDGGLAAIAAKETETDTDPSEAEPAGGDMPQPPSGGQQMEPPSGGGGGAPGGMEATMPGTRTQARPGQR